MFMKRKNLLHVIFVIGDLHKVASLQRIKKENTKLIVDSNSLMNNLKVLSYSCLDIKPFKNCEDSAEYQIYKIFQKS